MPGCVSLVDIRACFAEQWVLIGKPQVSEFGELRGGVVLCHSPARAEVEAYLRSHDVPEFVLLYTGRKPAAGELALLQAKPAPPSGGLEPRKGPGVPLVGWAAALLLAALVYFGTNDTWLGVATAFIRAGWSELCSAWWLFRSDPFRRRAGACLLFYVAAAMWKTWICAVGAMVLCAAFSRQQAFPAPPHFIVAAHSMVVALALTMLVGATAIVYSARGGIRIWIEPRIWTKCQGQFARISDVAWHLTGRNLPVVSVGAISMMLPLSVLALVGVWLMVLSERAGNNTLLMVLAFVVAFCLPVLIIPLFATLLEKVRARRAVECWPPGLIAMERIIPPAYYVPMPQ